MHSGLPGAILRMGEKPFDARVQYGNGSGRMGRSAPKWATPREPYGEEFAPWFAAMSWASPSPRGTTYERCPLARHQGLESRKVSRAAVPVVGDRKNKVGKRRVHSVNDQPRAVSRFLQRNWSRRGCEISCDDGNLRQGTRTREDKECTKTTLPVTSNYNWLRFGHPMVLDRGPGAEADIKRLEGVLAEPSRAISYPEV